MRTSRERSWPPAWNKYTLVRYRSRDFRVSAFRKSYLFFPWIFFSFSGIFYFLNASKKIKLLGATATTNSGLVSFEYLNFPTLVTGPILLERVTTEKSRCTISSASKKNRRWSRDIYSINQGKNNNDKRILSLFIYTENSPFSRIQNMPLFRRTFSSSAWIHDQSRRGIS